MFARHTRTRMRPSSIAQGLKSWASKLHPQLPLTNQESSRLLNALTSAFRQKLDEAHPRNTNEDSKHTVSSNTISKSASAFHSSAAHTDKHLESVLTNPLLGGRVLDYGTAKVDLTRNPHQDPIRLLEEYHEKGAASVPIAELCLSHVRHSVQRLPLNQQQATIDDIEPGRRTFKWLLETNLYDSKSYADNLAFIEHLVFFLVSEGRTENVWSWIKLDIKTDDVPQPVTGSWTRVNNKTKLFQYRWRGRVLRALIASKLGPVDSDGLGPSPQQMNSAFDTLFDICALKQSASRSEHLWWIPLGPISTMFDRVFKKLHIVRYDLDVVRFEKYIKLLPVVFDGAPDFLVDLSRAKMRLVHPRGRQPATAFKCFQQLFGQNPPDGARYFLASIRESGSSAAIQNWWNFATTTVYALRQQGSMDDADWLKDRCIKEFPRQARYFETKMEDCRRHDMSRGARVKNQETEVPDHTPIPFPTFA